MNTNNNPFSITYTPGQIAFITTLQYHAPSLPVSTTAFSMPDGTSVNVPVVQRADLVSVLQSTKYIAVPAWIACDPKRRAGRGAYMLPELTADVSALPVNRNTRGRKPGSRNTKGQTPAAVSSVVSSPAA